LPLSLVPPGLMADQLLPSPERVILLARANDRPATCPLCERPSTRVHSTYQRRLADLPWQGKLVELRVRVRRFRCSGQDCRRRIFAERLVDTTRPKARRTLRLGEAQRQIGLALGGEPGSRLAGKLAMPVSGDTLLRMIRAEAAEAVAALPHVIGVDDWAWRRGTRYGTIICDLERRRVVDLLPDRTADTLASWLRQHGSGISIVSRDRSGAYADGISVGAPKAVQVADRWHLLVNCADALRQLLDRHHRELRNAAYACVVTDRAAVVPPRRPGETQAQQRKIARQQRRQARYEAVARLHRQGTPIKRIAAELGIARKAVRRWVRAGEVAAYRRAPGPGLLDRHLAYVEQRWSQGCRNSAELWRELRRQQRFEGGYDTVRRWASRHRAAAAAATRTAEELPASRVPSSRRAARLLTTPAASLSAADRRLVAALIARSPEIGTAAELAQAFGQLVRQRDAAALDGWLTQAKSSGLRGFALGLSRDLDAVRAALSLPWSNGPVEGQVTRLKVLKRQMYGRAKFDLLRQRILHAA
jgi:transposase